MATLKQLRAEITEEVKKINSTGMPKLLGQMANQAHRSSLNRIFTSGQKSDGTPIGTYKASTKKLKARTGRPTGKIILRQTDTLSGSYTSERNGKNFQLGFLDVNRKDGGDNGRIAEANEKRFGKIFDLTDKELNELDLVVDNFINDIF